MSTIEKNIIEFPLHTKDFDDPMSEKELMELSRYWVAMFLNQVATGERKELTDKEKEEISFLNQCYVKVGVPELEIDF